MPTNASFDYAVLRVVPRVDREEFLNAGVILFCRERRFLACRIVLDWQRLTALHPSVDCSLAAQHLRTAAAICSGDAAGGTIAALTQSERFQWLAAPRSTLLQSSPVHSGVCTAGADLETRLAEIARGMVGAPPPDSSGLVLIATSTC